MVTKSDGKLAAPTPEMMLDVYPKVFPSFNIV